MNGGDKGDRRRKGKIDRLEDRYIDEEVDKGGGGGGGGGE